MARSSPSDRLPRSLVPLLIHAALVQGAVFVVRPTISYRAVEIGIDSALIGILAGTYTVLPLLIAIQLGRFSDRFGDRRLTAAGSLVLVAGAGTLLAYGHSLAGLAAASALLGVGHVAAVLGQQAMVGRLVPPTRVAGGYAYYTLTGSLGQALAPGLIAVFGAGQTIPDTGAIFTVTLAAVAVAVVLTFLLPAHTPAAGPRQRATGAVGTLLRIRGLPSAVIISGLVLAAIDVFIVYLPVLGTQIGLTAGTVGMLLMVRAFASVVSRFLLEPMQSRFGTKRLLVATVALAFVVMAVLPLMQSAPLLTVLMIPLGIGVGLAQPITMAWIATLAPAAMRGSAMSLRLTGNRLGQTVMPIIAGGVAGTAGTAGVFWTLAVCLGAATLQAARSHVTVIGNE